VLFLRCLRFVVTKLDEGVFHRMQVDLPRAELERYRPSLTQEPDFDTFWQQSLAESTAQPLDAIIEAVEYPVERVQVFHVTYAGFGPDTRIAGWWIVPTDKNLNLPTIVQYHGYSGSKDVPMIYLHWALQGCSVFAVDVRGQDGETPDNARYPHGSAVGYMTKGISDPQAYFYRNVYLDCVRALTFVRSQPGVESIAITGASQGGGLTLAVAGLDRGSDIVAAMPDVPFLCHFQRSIEVSTTGPYPEFVNHWKRHPYDYERDLRTLSYFDGINFAPRITCPALLSVALLDTTCPPSTGYAVYHHLGSAHKELRVYPFNGHEGGTTRQEQEKYRFIREVMVARVS
jgi:cephalosporin-C deacetylase